MQGIGSLSGSTEVDRKAIPSERPTLAFFRLCVRLTRERGLQSFECSVLSSKKAYCACAITQHSLRTHRVASVYKVGVGDIYINLIYMR